MCETRRHPWIWAALCRGQRVAPTPPRDWGVELPEMARAETATEGGFSWILLMRTHVHVRKHNPSESSETETMTLGATSGASSSSVRSDSESTCNW